MSTKKWTLGIRKRLVALGLAGVMTAFCIQPRPAQAALPVATVVAVVAFIQKAYGYYKQFAAFFGSGNAGPTLAQQLAAVQAAIIDEIHLVANGAWVANAQTVYDKFVILGWRNKSDPANLGDWQLATNTAQTVMNGFAGPDGVAASLNSTDLYKLAPMYTQVVAAYVGLLKAKREITPGFPPTWGEHDIYLKRAMNASYQLIGAQSFMCWPGGNPGAGNYDPLHATSGSGSNYKKSILWKKLGNKDIKVADITVFGASKLGCTGGSGTVRPGTCNPGTRTCKVTWAGGEIMSPSYACYSPRPFPTSSSLSSADAIFKPQFDGDAVVKILRAHVIGTQNVGGGDDRWDGPSTTLPAQGMLTDPWVNEAECNNMAGSFGPWAYPMKP